MTGYGQGVASSGEVEVIVRLRSVNHRYLDVALRLPKYYASFEPHIRKIVAQHVRRGKLDVNISRSAGRSAVTDVAVDDQLAQKYYRCLDELRTRLALEGGITVADLLTLDEIVLPVEKSDQAETELPLVEQGLRDALEAHDAMRRTEGDAMWKDMQTRLGTISEIADRIAPLVEQVTLAAKERLARRVEDLTGGMKLDPDRLLQETALIADRADVTEEITRLKSHVKQFLAFGKEGSPIGRKLEFLLQELHREVNTIASKSASTELALHVVEAKAEVEKIREQTQNIE